MLGKKSVLFNRILMNLEHDLYSSEFPTRRGHLPDDRATGSSLCARVALCASPSESFITWAWASTQNCCGTVLPAYSGVLLAHNDTLAKSSRPCSMVAVLVVTVSEYICEHISVGLCTGTTICAEKVAH